MNNWVRSGLILMAVLTLLIAFIPTPPTQITQTTEEPTQKKPTVVRTKATMEEKRENRRIIKQYSRALGYTDKQITCLLTLWTRESRLDHFADNPRSTAFGIAQLLRERSRTPELQILHGIRYIGHRYRGDSCRALAHSDRRGWY